MNIAVHVPRIAAPGVRMVLESVRVEAGASVEAGDRLLEIRIGSLCASIHSEVSGTVQDVRVAAGDALTADRVMLWIESADLPPLTGEPAEFQPSALSNPAPQNICFRFPEELLPSRAAVVHRVEAGADGITVEVAMGAARFEWRATAQNAQILVTPGDELKYGTPIARLKGEGAVSAERTSLPPRIEIPELTIAEFRETAGRLSRPVEELAELAALAGTAKGAELLRRDMAELAARRFSIAVVGEFKRGKSTFLNALAGGEFLPHDVIPCTAFACRFQYGDQPELALVDADGCEKVQPLSTVPEIVAELNRLTRDPQTSIQEAIVRLPLEICRDGVDLIDTPGLNDSEAMNQVTLSVLPNVDAAVLLLIPESPLSGSETSFLVDHLLAKDIGRVLFVLTAKDRISSGQLDRLTGYLEQQLQRILAARGRPDDAPVKLLSISSREELGHPGSETSGFSRLREELNHLIFRERGRLLLGQMLQRIRRAAGDAQTSARLRLTQLAVSREAFQASLHHSERRISLIRLHANELRRQVAEAQSQAEIAAGSRAQHLYTALLGMRESLPGQVTAELLRRPADQIKTELGSFLHQNAGKLYQEAITALLTAVEAAFDPAAQAVRRFFDQTARRSMAQWEAPPETLEFSGGFLFRIDLSLGALSWLRLADAAKSVLSAGDLASSIESRALASLRESFGREIEQQVRQKSGEAALRSKLIDVVRRPFHHLMRRLDQETKARVEDSAATLASLREPSADDTCNWQEIYEKIGNAAEECDAVVFGSRRATG